MHPEGMGVLRASGTRLAPTGAEAETVIPIKFAEECTKRKMRKVWSAGESCPKKVLAPQKLKAAKSLPPITTENDFPGNMERKLSSNLCPLGYLEGEDIS